MDRRRTLGLATIGTLGVAGCIQPMYWTGARALPAGETRVTAGAGAVVAPEPLLRYEAPPPTEAIEPSIPRRPDPLGPRADARSPEKRFPSFETTPAASVRITHGFGHGFDAWAALDAPFIAFGLGLGAGTRWQFLGGDHGPVAAALTARAGLSLGANSSGDTSGRLLVVSPELAVPVELAPFDALGVYVIPRAAFLHLSFAHEAAGREHESSDAATALGLNAGLRLALGSGAELVLEAGVTRVLPGPDRSEAVDALHGGIGLSFPVDRPADPVPR